MKNKEIEFLIEQIEMDLNEGISPHAPDSFTQEDRLSLRSRNQYKDEMGAHGGNFTDKEEGSMTYMTIAHTLGDIKHSANDNPYSDELWIPDAKWIANHIMDALTSTTERMPKAEVIVSMAKKWIQGEVLAATANKNAWRGKRFRSEEEINKYKLTTKKILKGLRDEINKPEFLKYIKRKTGLHRLNPLKWAEDIMFSHKKAKRSNRLQDV